MCAKALGHETACGIQTLELFPCGGCRAISEVRQMSGTGKLVPECGAGRRLCIGFGT